MKGIYPFFRELILGNEQRFNIAYTGTGSNFWGSMPNQAGEPVGSDSGTRIDTVYTCLNVLGREIGSTVYDVKQKTPEGRIVADKNPVHRLLHTRPNQFTTAYNFWYSNVWLYNSWGNAYNLILRDSKRQPGELIQLMPWEVSIEIENGNVFYVHNRNETFSARDILHYKHTTKDGITGISPITHNSELMGYKLKQQKYSSRVIGEKPVGYMSSEVATPEQGTAAVEGWNKTVQGDSIKGTPFLSGGFKYNQLMINPEDGQYLETAQYTDQKILGIYNMPPNFAQDFKDGIKANSEQQAIILVKHTLMPHYFMIEQENNEKLFPAGNTSLFTKFNIASKLRGDLKARFEAYHIGVNDGFMNLNQVRELEDWNKGPKELDKFFQNGNFAEVGKGPMMDADRKMLEILNSNGKKKEHVI